MPLITVLNNYFTSLWLADLGLVDDVPLRRALGAIRPRQSMGPWISERDLGMLTSLSKPLISKINENNPSQQLLNKNAFLLSFTSFPNKTYPAEQVPIIMKSNCYKIMLFSLWKPYSD